MIAFFFRFVRNTVRNTARNTGAGVFALLLVHTGIDCDFAQAQGTQRQGSLRKTVKKTSKKKTARNAGRNRETPSITVVQPVNELPDLNRTLQAVTLPPAPACGSAIAMIPSPSPVPLRNSDWIFQGVSVSTFNDNFPNFFGTPQGKRSPDNWLSGDDYGHTFGISASVRLVLPDAAHETDWLVITGVTTDNYAENLYRIHQREDGRTIADQKSIALTRIFVVARSAKWDQTKPHLFEQFAFEAGIRNPTDSIPWDANSIQEWFHGKLLNRATIPQTVAGPDDRITPFFSALSGIGYFIPLNPSSASKWGDTTAIPRSVYAIIQAGFKINSSGTRDNPLDASNLYALGTVSLPLGKNFVIDGANYVRFYAKNDSGRTVAAIRGDASVTLTYSGLPVDLGLTYTRPYGDIDAEKSLFRNESPSSKMRFTIGVPLTPAFELINH